MDTEILRCAQDDTRVPSIAAAFCPTLAGLLNEYVGVKGYKFRPNESPGRMEFQ